MKTKWGCFIMNQDLENAMVYFNNYSKNRGRSDYKPCYDSLLKYLNVEKYDNKSVKELFSAISLADIDQACKLYYDSSKKTKTYMAIHRFLLAMDYFYENYLIESRIKCVALEGGCNNKARVLKIAEMINDIDKGKIHLPLEGKNIDIIEKSIDEMDENKFYHLEQKIIYRLLSTYGFKENRIINMLKVSFSRENKTLGVQNEGYSIELKLDELLYNDLLQFYKIHKYKESVYLFTNTNGSKLIPATMLPTLKVKVVKKGIKDFCPTSIGLYGIVNLIGKGLNISEINILTGFDITKIKDVSDYMLLDKDINKIINEKITL